MNLKDKLRSSSASIIISMSLVLFVLGILGFLLINANRLSNHVKENIGFSIMIKEGIKDVDIMQLQSMGSRMRVMEDLCRIIAFMNIEDGVFKIFEVSED